VANVRTVTVAAVAALVTSVAAPVAAVAAPVAAVVSAPGAVVAACPVAGAALPFVMATRPITVAATSVRTVVRRGRGIFVLPPVLPVAFLPRAVAHRVSFVGAMARCGVRGGVVLVPIDGGGDGGR